MAGTERITVQPGPVTVRLIQPGSGTGATSVLGRAMLGSTTGLNNQAGWQNGNFQRIMLQEGAFTLTFPNRDAQGQYWRDRFMITNPDIEYRPGDEWVEIYQDRELVYVGTPTKATVDANQVQITGWDSYWMLKRTREFDLGWWWDDPQSVLYHYSQAWRTLIADPCLPDEPDPGRSLAATSGASATLTSNGVVLTGSAGGSAANTIKGNLTGAQCWRAELTLTVNSFSGTPTVYMQVKDSVSTYTFGLSWNSSGTPTITISTDTYSYVAPTNLSGVPVGVTQQIVMERRYDYVTVFLDGYVLGTLPAGNLLIPTAAAAVQNAANQLTPTAQAIITPLVTATYVGGITTTGIRNIYYTDAGYGEGPVYGDTWGPGGPPIPIDPYPDLSAAIETVMSANGPMYTLLQNAESATSTLQNFASTSNTNPAAAIPMGTTALNSLAYRSDSTATTALQNAISAAQAAFTQSKQFYQPRRSGYRTPNGDPSITTIITALQSALAQVSPAQTAASNAVAPINTLISDDQAAITGNISVACELYAPSGSTVTVTQTSALLRSLQPFLMDPPAGTPLIDTPPTGGLAGIFIDRSNYQTLSPTADTTRLMMAPDVPQDGVTYGTPGPISFASNTAATFVPPGTPTWWVMARFTGAIWLDLANSDYNLLLAAAPAARIWVGRTVGVPNVLADLQGNNGYTNLTTGGLRAKLGSVSGWYPIRIDYAQMNGTSALALYYANSSVSWTLVPGSWLSPYGCYTTQIRRQSHYDAFQQVASAFGYQYATEPKRLESGQFPGRIQWGERIGRDTDKVLDEIEGQAWQVQLDAEACSDAVQADASGIPDPSGLQQLSGEAFNMPEMGTHMFPITDYQSMSDITDRGLLQQRLQQYLILESSPWEQVGITPPGYREARNGFQLTGDLAEFNWEPGDGIRLNLPTIGVIDESPRQITSVTRDITPDGCKPPQVAFRDRPRSLAQLIRNMQQTTLNYQRSYQGQVKWVSGSLGGTSNVGAVDAYSRLWVSGEVLRMVVHLNMSSDASGWTLEVDGVSTGFGIGPGVMILDVTKWLVTAPVGRGSAYHYARVTGGSGGWQGVQLAAQMRG